MFRIALLVLCCLFQWSCMPIGQQIKATLSTDATTILEPPKAEVEQGRLSGLWQKTDEDLLAVFRGVPFAAPPLGRLRWAAPVDPLPWVDEKDATEFGAQCMQSSSLSLFTASLIRGQGMPETEAQAIISSLASRTPPANERGLLIFKSNYTKYGTRKKSASHGVVPWWEPSNGNRIIANLPIY